jgi:hypothetical protein
MTLTLSILGFASLFALFGALQRPKPKCSSNCGACEHACADDHGQDDL